jgi:hypothetical protein
MTKLGFGVAPSAGFYSEYDAGKLEAVTSSVRVDIEKTAVQLLIYPKKESFIKLNGSEKEIYLPAESWTPISVAVEYFEISAPVASDIYWQGWCL